MLPAAVVAAHVLLHHSIIYFIVYCSAKSVCIRACAFTVGKKWEWLFLLHILILFLHLCMLMFMHSIFVRSFFFLFDLTLPHLIHQNNLIFYLFLYVMHAIYFSHKLNENMILRSMNALCHYNQHRFFFHYFVYFISLAQMLLLV